MYPFPLHTPQCLVPLQVEHVINFFVSLPVNIPVSIQYSPFPPQTEQIQPPLQLGHSRRLLLPEELELPLSTLAGGTII